MEERREKYREETTVLKDFTTEYRQKLCTPEEADEEGKQTMRALARNMTFLMKSIALGKEQFGLPEKETRVSTNFIR